MVEKKIGIIGCGNMGEALLSRLSGVLEKSTMLMVSESDPKRREYIQSRYKIIVEVDNDEMVKRSDVVILAVKPKDLTDVLKNVFGCGISEDKLLISIAAGVTTKYIESIVGKEIPVIRVMSNVASTIGEAVSSISRGSAARLEDAAIAKEIFSMLGEVVEVDERLVDAVTAVSGSGPAYFFYFVAALIEAAEKSGLDEDTARRLVFKTFTGSAKLLEKLKESPLAFIEKVASKGGTTEAALKIFKKKNLKDIVKEAVAAARKRSKELSKG